MGDDVVQEFQVVVAGNAEDLGDAEFGEAVEQVVADGVNGSLAEWQAARIGHEARRYARSKQFRAGRRRAIVPAMAVKESREVVIEASPKEILDVVADVEAMPEWSSIHQSAEVLERDATVDRGAPR